MNIIKPADFLSIAIFMGGLAVVAGAFGAHLLKPVLLSNHRLDTYQTAVFYHFIHVIMMVITGFWIRYSARKILVIAWYAFFFGIFLFSGSLYFLSLYRFSPITILTPIGGVLYVVGWILLFFGAKGKTS